MSELEPILNPGLSSGGKVTPNKMFSMQYTSKPETEIQQESHYYWGHS